MPIGTTELILIQRYFVSYTCTTEHILVLRILYWYYGAYSCTSDLILVFWSLYLYYESYSCLKDLILMLRNLYLSYGTYTCHSISGLRRSYNYTCSLSLSFYSFLLYSSTYQIYVYCYFLVISISFLITYSN